MTLYSTQHAFGQQTGQTESPSGRLHLGHHHPHDHLPDGRTATDTVRPVPPRQVSPAAVSRTLRRGDITRDRWPREAGTTAGAQRPGAP